MARESTAIGVDRLLAFADAVTAIAITLLALEITVPEGLSETQLGHALGHALVKLSAYLLSFAVVGLLWLAHHKLFGLIATLDTTMVRLELAFLAVVAALPFPTRLLSEYGQTTEATAVYAGSIALAGALMTVMALRLRADGPLRVPEAPHGQIGRVVFANASLTAVFTTSIPVALASPLAAKYWWLLLLPVRLIRRFRKLPALM